jgi:nicotinamide-nucleotide amidase
MKIALLSTGTELTRGELVNTNVAWLSERLTALGASVVEHVVVDDDRERIESALRRLSEFADVIISTGGLGPTTDDLTTEVVAKTLGASLFRDEPSIEKMKRRFEKFGRVMSPSNEKQAYFPIGATVLSNDQGTAPGFSVKLGKSMLYVLPGVPREMKPMVEEHIAKALGFVRTSAQIHLRSFGLPESTLGDKLAGLEEAYPGVVIGYRAHFPEVEVKVFAQAASEDEAHALAERVATIVRERVGDSIYGGKDDSLPQVVLHELETAKMTLGVAESCSGGLVGHLLTQIPGASRVLIADVVAYANAAKTEFLGVPPELIEAHGAVSEEVALAMARGIKARAKTSFGLSITGVAGPDGGTEAKPVGTVIIAAVGPTTESVERYRFPWSRDFVQKISAHSGLWKVRMLAHQERAAATEKRGSRS